MDLRPEERCVSDDVGLSPRSRTIQSVERACTIMFLLAADGDGESTAELARRMGVHKSTVSRLLATLQDAGLVERTERNGSFRLGLGNVLLAGSVLGQSEIVRIADPPLRRLAEETGETVNLAVRHRQSVMNIQQIPGANISRSFDWIGKTAPLHEGAAAKALLANLRRADIDAYLHAMNGDHIDRMSLRNELEEIRRRGVAINRGEHDPGIYAVGAPIFDSSGNCQASISVAGYKREFSEPRIADLGERVLNTARTISQQFGFQSRRHAPFA